MKIHIVQKGDTLWELSKKYGVDFEALKQANPQLATPDMVMPGMKVKIPSNSKAVKKESEPAKETQKKETQQPYQDHTPKPMPVIKEDDHGKKMMVKPEMPVSPSLQMPEQPMMNAPMMEQEFQNYTTINFPQMPQYHETNEKKPKEQVKSKAQPVPKEQMKAEAQPMPQPQFQPMPFPMPQPQSQPMPQPGPMLPLCCHIVHPCYPPAPFSVMANPESFHPSQPMQHGMPYGQMNAPAMEMPTNPLNAGGHHDCGCHRNSPMQQFDMQAYENNSQYPTGQMSHEQQGMQPGEMYPPQFATNQHHHNLYPNPPAYPDFHPMENREADETSGE